MDEVVQSVEEDESEVMAAAEVEDSILVLANNFGEMRYMYGSAGDMTLCHALSQVIAQHRPWFMRQIEAAKVVLMTDGDVDIITPFDGFSGLHLAF